MDLTKLFFGGSTYRRLKFTAFFAILLAPLFNTATNFAVDPSGGGGTKHEQTEAEKELSKKLTSDVKKQLADFKDEYKKIQEKAMEGVATKKEFKDLGDQVSELIKDLNPKITVKHVYEMAEKAMMEINALREVDKSGKGNKPVSKRDALKQVLIDAGMTEEYTNDFQEKTLRIKDPQGLAGRQSEKIETKVAVDITQSDSWSGIANAAVTDYEPQVVSRIPLNPDMTAFEIFDTRPVNNRYMGLIVAATYVDGSATKAEGSAADQSSMLFTSEEFKVFDIVTYVKFAVSSMEDADFIVDEILAIVPDKIKEQIDSKIFSSSGDGNSDIKGLFVTGNHTDFARATYANSVPDATVIDVIKKAKLQARKAKYPVNAVILDSDLIDEIESKKDADNNSVNYRFVKYDNDGRLVRIAGLAVAENNQFDNELVVCDTRKAVIGIRRGTTLVIGLDGNDLTKNMRTFFFSTRVAFGVRDAGAIIYDNDVAASVGVLNIT